MITSVALNGRFGIATSEQPSIVNPLGAVKTGNEVSPLLTI